MYRFVDSTETRNDYSDQWLFQCTYGHVVTQFGCSAKLPKVTKTEMHARSHRSMYSMCLRKQSSVWILGIFKLLGVNMCMCGVWIVRKISGLTDSLVGLYFEVSAFLKLVSIFVPAEGRAGIPRRLALQVQLVPFHQRLASHRPELRSRGWTERERERTRGERKSKLALLKLTTDIQLIYPFNCASVCVFVFVCLWLSVCVFMCVWLMKIC